MNVSVKSIVCGKKMVIGHIFVTIVGNLKSIVDYSIIVCEEIVNVSISASTNVTNTVLTNVKSIVSISSEMDCYNLHKVLLVTILHNHNYLLSLHKT